MHSTWRQPETPVVFAEPIGNETATWAGIVMACRILAQ